MKSWLRYLACAAALACLLPAAAAAIPSRNLDVLANFNDYPPVNGAAFGAGYASCWAYVHGDGREYAVIGCTNGTAIYNVTNPAASYFVAFITGPNSPWREMKSYRNWIYVVTEANGAPNNGLQIIRMTDPEHPVLAGTYTTNFSTSHTVSVDTTRAILICNGTRFWSGGSGLAMGMRILSIANPEAPVEVSWWPGGSTPVPTNYYVHDCVPVGNRVYAASVYAGIERVIDLTNPATPTEITSWTYPGAYLTHNSWPDSTEHFLYVTDEQNGQTLRVFDISSLATPSLVYEYSPNPQAIVHNAHVKGHELYLANYTEGVRIMDLSDPGHPAEFAWADTYPGTSGSYFGVWGICPYFPSGTVIASDMQTGLYVMRPVRDYGILRARVVEATSSDPFPGVVVNLVTQGDSLTSPPDGLVAFAPSPGTHTVEVNEWRYDVVSETRVVTPGSRDSVTLPLTLKPTANVSGTIRNATTSALLQDAEVILAYTPVHERTDAAGHYALSFIPDDFYRVEARRAGYAPLLFHRQIGPGYEGTQDLTLVPAATWDALEAASGWIVSASGDNATTGFWTRVAPLGTGTEAASSSFAASRSTTARGGSMRAGSATIRGGSIESFFTPAAHSCGGSSGLTTSAEGSTCSAHSTAGVPAATKVATEGSDDDNPGHCGCGTACLCAVATGLGQVQASSDHTPGTGTMCFITGQATGSGPDDGDIDGGRTTLTSPAYNLAAMTRPTIGYWRWFFSNGDANDWLAVSISNDNGANWTAVDTTRGVRNEWSEQAIDVAAFVTPTAQVKVRFAAADLGAASYVEAGIDDIVLYDKATLPVGVDDPPAATALAFAAPRPNPSAGDVRFTLAVPRAADVDLEVLDLAGRRVRTLHHGFAAAGTLALRWDGADESGHRVAAGLYYARARSGDETASVRFARVK